MRASELVHEVGDDTVEVKTVVEAVVGQVDEVGWLMERIKKAIHYTRAEPQDTRPQDVRRVLPEVRGI